MGLYDVVIRPFVRKMDLERAARVSLGYFRLVGKVPFARKFIRFIYGNRPEGLEREVFGLKFYNPVGLGAGLDVNGELYNDLNNLGFSFIEIGPMDSSGVRCAIRNILSDRPNDLLAVCINKDHLTSFTLAYDFCDFFVIEIASESDLDGMDAILEARISETEQKPVILKIPEQSTQQEIDTYTTYCLMNRVDGIEARSIAQVKQISEHSLGKLPVIANTHIDTPFRAQEALSAGASLVEVRTALVKEGPHAVSRMLKYLINSKKHNNNELTTTSTISSEGSFE